MDYIIIFVALALAVFGIYQVGYGGYYQKPWSKDDE